MVCDSGFISLWKNFLWVLFTVWIKYEVLVAGKGAFSIRPFG